MKATGVQFVVAEKDTWQRLGTVVAGRRNRTGFLARSLQLRASGWVTWWCVGKTPTRRSGKSLQTTTTLPVSLESLDRTTQVRRLGNP
jgi:hypothetical protein